MFKKVILLVMLCALSIISKAQKKPVQKMALVDGKALYAKHCVTCHQVDGVGAENMIPPLIKTEYVLGPKPALIKIVLNGLSGEIKVNGDYYAGEMPAQNILKDGEIAAILTYVRKSFGNNASAVTAAEVKKVRATNKK